MFLLLLYAIRDEDTIRARSQIIVIQKEERGGFPGFWFDCESSGYKFMRGVSVSMSFRFRWQ